MIKVLAKINNFMKIMRIKLKQYKRVFVNKRKNKVIKQKQKQTLILFNRIKILIRIKNNKLWNEILYNYHNNI